MLPIVLISVFLFTAVAVFSLQAHTLQSSSSPNNQHPLSRREAKQSNLLMVKILCQPPCHYRSHTRTSAQRQCGVSANTHFSPLYFHLLLKKGQTTCFGTMNMCLFHYAFQTHISQFDCFSLVASQAIGIEGPTP